MRILLLGTPRSGSTSLYNLIKDHLSEFSYQSFIEPFNPILHERYMEKGYDFTKIDSLDNYKDLFVKTLYFSDPYDYNNNAFSSNREYINWCIKSFDKIIIILRRNNTEQAESFIINEECSRLYGQSWHTPKVYRIDRIDKDLKNSRTKRFDESSKDLINLALENDIKVFYYEDIFINKDLLQIESISSYIGLGEFKKSLTDEYILNESRRVRIEDSKDFKLI